MIQWYFKSLLSLAQDLGFDLTSTPNSKEELRVASSARRLKRVIKTKCVRLSRLAAILSGGPSSPAYIWRMGRPRPGAR